MPVFDEIVLSLSRMNQIINFDHRAGAVAVEVMSENEGNEEMKMIIGELM